ncbi:TRAP transporter small permease [Roseospira marina]|uniref:TRAP transporter small permease protein n=1 Tax=Roseospira marina TaxID=140057 RepID=A0A5M6IAB6_9PROT|nr:TRAP transporter small permease [Roseospira marina]KAA5604669.1 TRAP transporter small permease [Roseospira marina]MBB4315114.1 TRAP-type C4-dicarboxylate transport system permease small subunit [Roseospira marina]MBB5088116.1 TRAP-type C4-dicarboxylate transport system permease small subunit [Roseospira marina]
MSDPLRPSVSNENLPSTPEPDPHKAAEGVIRTGLDRVIARAADGIAWLVFIAMAISVFEVVMRYAFHAPTSWVHETTVILIAALFALGGPVALARDKHIRVRVIYDAVPPRARRWLDVFNNGVILAFCVGMTYAAWQLFYRATHNPSGAISLEGSGTSWNPPFPAVAKGFILLAVGLMAVQAALHLIQSLRARPDADAAEDR